jgi:hypothetical protein
MFNNLNKILYDKYFFYKNKYLKLKGGCRCNGTDIDCSLCAAYANPRPQLRDFNLMDTLILPGTNVFKGLKENEVEITRGIEPSEVDNRRLLETIDFELSNRMVSSYEILEEIILDIPNKHTNIEIIKIEHIDHIINQIKNQCTHLTINEKHNNYTTLPVCILQLTQLKYLNLNYAFNIATNDEPLLPNLSVLPNLQVLEWAKIVHITGVRKLWSTYPLFADLFTYKTIINNVPDLNNIDIIRIQKMEKNFRLTKNILEASMISFPLFRIRSEHLPTNLSLLNNLHRFNFGSGWLNNLPDEFYNLSNLKSLSFGEFYNFPINEKILQLQNLTQMDIGTFFDHKIPDNIFLGLKNLRRIRVTKYYYALNWGQFQNIKQQKPEIEFIDYYKAAIIHDNMTNDTALRLIENMRTQNDLRDEYIKRRHYGSTILPNAILSEPEKLALSLAYNDNIEFDEMNPEHTPYIETLKNIGWYKKNIRWITIDES